MRLKGIYHTDYCEPLYKSAPDWSGERRKMRGNKSKISSMTGKHEFNTDFDRLLSDADHGRLKVDHRATFERPAYYGTSQCIGRNAKTYDCKECPYFHRLTDEPKKSCKYPWDDPDEAAMEVIEFLPCQK